MGDQALEEPEIPCPAPIKLKLAQIEDEKSELHNLPITIHHSGRARVSSFWQPIPASSSQNASGESQNTKRQLLENVEYEATFRGRQLKARRLDLMAVGARAVVLRQAASGPRDEPIDSWSCAWRRSELMYWRREHAPTAADPLPRALQWLPAAAVLHAPSPPPK